MKSIIKLIIFSVLTYCALKIGGVGFHSPNSSAADLCFLVAFILECMAFYLMVVI